MISICFMIFLCFGVNEIILLLGKDTFYYGAMHIGESVITPLKAISKLGVINPH